MGRRRNWYSLTKKILCPITRLRELLQLNNNPILFRNFQRQLYGLAKKHLTLEELPREQRERWNAIESELLSTFPDVFDCEDPKTRLELAMRMIASYHYRRRSASKHQAQSLGHIPKQQSSVMSVSVPTRASLKKETKKQKEKENYIINLTEDDKEEKVEPKVSQMMDVSNLSIKVASRPISPLTFNSSHIAGPSTRSRAALIKSQTTPLQTSNNASVNVEDPFQLTGVTQVAGFLNACFPPMAHFLRHFIDFGCTSEAYLVAISAWPADRISCFLSQVSSCQGHEREFSEMDILILQNHFVSYFNKAQT